KSLKSSSEFRKFTIRNYHNFLKTFPLTFRHGEIS
ncbi:unnamed protein product, partial [Heterotrigona itama]